LALVAAAAAPPFLAEVVALIATGAVIAYVGTRFGIMPIVSFLITGAVLGPHALGVVHDEALIESAAELGVVLLLFTIGIEFSLEKLARIKRLILIGGGLQVALVVLLVTGLLSALGVPWRAGVFTGCLVALSSTAIVMKLLMERGGMNSTEGQAALGILIFQDLAVVAMVLLVPMLGGMGGGATDIGLALVKAAGIVVLVIVAARRVMPRILEAVARTCSQEIFLLTVVSICLGTAWLTSLAGVSLSLGAFLAGLVVSESRFSHMAFGEILPLQILFSALFFVSVGLLLDVGFLVANPLPVLGVIAAVLVIKTLGASAGLLAMKYPVVPALGSAVILAQVGEFSFVLERAGREAGLFPAGIRDGGPETFIAATVALMIGSPLLYRGAEWLQTRGGRGPEADAGPTEATAGEDLRDHVIVAGFGTAGRELARELTRRGTPLLVVTLSPDGAHEAERLGFPVLRGNYTRQHELELAAVRQARLFVVADDEFETAERAVAAARTLNPALPILVATPSAGHAPALDDRGATDVVVAEHEGLVGVLGRALALTGAPGEEVHEAESRLRDAVRTAVRERGAAGTTISVGKPVSLSAAERASRRCSHTADAREVTSRTHGCETCLELDWDWVHLRICLTCGYVGCCDSSRGRHATKHYHAEGHPLVKSLEPEDAWVWCYDDRTFL
jgi:CPA2 family monovalent cation:H+ antiporter-2